MDHELKNLVLNINQLAALKPGRSLVAAEPLMCSSIIC